MEVKADKFSDISRGFWRRVNALKDSQGDHTIPASLPEIWEIFGNSPDKDSAKNLTAHIHRFNVSALAETITDMAEQEQEEERSLRKLAKEIRELDAE